jgi:MFS family permease
MSEKEGLQQKKSQARKISVVEGSMYCVMDGTGLRYITPFALALGANNAQIAFLNSAPTLLGNLSQLQASKLMHKHSRQTLCLWGSLIQAILWLFVIGAGALYFFAGLSSFWSSMLLIFIYTILMIFGSFLSPIWNSWMQDLVDKNQLGKYFGFRNRITNLVGLFIMLGAGFLLDYFKQTHLFLVFSILFAIAFLARTVSALLFKKQYEPELKLEEKSYFSFWSFLKNLTKNNFGKFVIAFSTLIFATNIASPFFTVYMFKQLNFTYTQYIITTIAYVLSGLIFVPAWGKFSDHYGNLKTLKICGAMIPLVALGWLLSIFVYKNNPSLVLYYLIPIEAMSGLAWAGFNLAAVNFIYDSMDRQQSVLGFSYFNILNGIGVILGAALGGLIASFEINLWVFNSILIVFALSFILRFLAVVIFIPQIKEVRACPLFGMEEAKNKLWNLSPEQMFNYLDLNFVVQEIREVEKIGLEKHVEKILKTPPEKIINEIKWDFKKK